MKTLAQKMGSMTVHIEAVDDNCVRGVINQIGRKGLCSFKAERKATVIIPLDKLTILEPEKMAEVYEQFPEMKQDLVS